MIDHVVNHDVETTLSVVFGVFIINMVCESSLGFSPLDALKRLINKITNSKKRGVK